MRAAPIRGRAALGEGAPESRRVPPVRDHRRAGEDGVGDLAELKVCWALEVEALDDLLQGGGRLASRLPIREEKEGEEVRGGTRGQRREVGQGDAGKLFH